MLIVATPFQLLIVVSRDLPPDLRTCLPVRMTPLEGTCCKEDEELGRDKAVKPFKLFMPSVPWNELDDSFPGVHARVVVGTEM
jgi:hypothetical protein